jgi:hypothetical protein
MDLRSLAVGSAQSPVLRGCCDGWEVMGGSGSVGSGGWAAEGGSGPLGSGSVESSSISLAGGDGHPKKRDSAGEEGRPTREERERERDALGAK